MLANSGGGRCAPACNKWQLKISDRGCGSSTCGAKATRARIASSRGVTAALAFLLIFTQEVARGLVLPETCLFLETGKICPEDLLDFDKRGRTEDRREGSHVEEAGITRGIVVLGEQDGSRPSALTVRCYPCNANCQLRLFVDRTPCFPVRRWLQDVTPSSHLLPSRAVIAPHAGYSYSGPTAAHAYRHLDPKRCN